MTTQITFDRNIGSMQNPIIKLHKANICTKCGEECYDEYGTAYEDEEIYGSNRVIPICITVSHCCKADIVDEKGEET